MDLGNSFYMELHGKCLLNVIKKKSSIYLLPKQIYTPVCYYHIMYEFQSESTLKVCLNVKELLARSRHHIWSLNDNNEIRTRNHLVCKRTLNSLAKLVECSFTN